MKSIKIENTGKYIEISDKYAERNFKFYDVRRAPFQLYGLYDPQRETQFKRMPTEIAQQVNKNVSVLHTNTAGGRVRFSTDSPFVAIKAVMKNISISPKIGMAGRSGFDLYLDSPDGMESLFHLNFVPPVHMTDGYESKVEFYESGMHYITINFPTYNDVCDLYIGIADGSYLGEGAPYRSLAPIVYYGSSITQGAAASRPGNVYQAMVSRALNLDYLNLGFSSGALGEDVMIRYMASLNMSAFVSDYDHNAESTEHLANTHKKVYEGIRAAHPDIPYIIMSRPDFHRMLPLFGGNKQSVERREVIMNTLHDAYRNGDENVYFIDGESLFREPWGDSATVDGCHPNDLGFYFMAKAVTELFKRILRDEKMRK